MVGYLLMAFGEDDDEPIGRFSVEANGRVINCLNGTNVKLTTRSK